VAAKALVKIPEVLLQVLPVRLLRHAVHSGRCICPNGVGGALQRLHVDLVGERVEPSFRLASRSLRYLSESR